MDSFAREQLEKKYDTTDEEKEEQAKTMAKMFLEAAGGNVINLPSDQLPDFDEEKEKPIDNDNKISIERRDEAVNKESKVTIKQNAKSVTVLQRVGHD
jgi:hypothetical protein